MGRKFRDKILQVRPHLDSKHKFDHTWTTNPCDWLPCRRAALPLVGCPHSLVYLRLPVVKGLIFCISATPHLGTSFPLFHGCKGVPVQVLVAGRLVHSRSRGDGLVDSQAKITNILTAVS